MVKKSYFVTFCIALLAAGLINTCDSSTETNTDPVIGTWSGAAGRLGGGGDALDSFGIVIDIKEQGQSFTITRGNKVWGSSLYMRDSTRDAGAWAKNAPGDSIIFTPDTANDSCFQKVGEEQIPWTQCRGLDVEPDYCDCFPPMWLKINISGNTWPNVTIENPKLAGLYDTLTLTRN